MYKILIVEDDLIIAKTVKNHIKSWGYEVECVTDFKDVLAIFAFYNPQLILLDITLPFLTAITGVMRLERFLRFLLCICTYFKSLLQNC